MAAIRQAKRRQKEDRAAGEPSEGPDMVRLAQIEAVLRMQGQYKGQIIRRTIDSKDWRGSQLLNLPPYRAVHAILTLTEREMAIILELAERAKES